MRRLSMLLAVLAVLAFMAFVWPSRWRYDHITVDQDTYLVRVERLSGRAEILVPELGWTPAEMPWDADAPPADDRQSATGHL